MQEPTWQRITLFFSIVIALGACSAGPQVTRTQELSETADTPYQKILIITLLRSFDARRYFEEEVVLQLSNLGTDAVASTSMMNTKTPVTRQTFLAMVDEIGADAVLVTQLLSLESIGKQVDMNPRATHNVRPTYYYNVWSVELTEYVEPPAVEFEHSLALATQIYSVQEHEAVWAIESKTQVKQDFDKVGDFSVIRNEVDAITTYLSRDGLLVQ